MRGSGRHGNSARPGLIGDLEGPPRRSACSWLLPDLVLPAWWRPSECDLTHCAVPIANHPPDPLVLVRKHPLSTHSDELHKNQPCLRRVVIVHPNHGLRARLAELQRTSPGRTERTPQRRSGRTGTEVQGSPARCQGGELDSLDDAPRWAAIQHAGWSPALGISLRGNGAPRGYRSTAPPPRRAGAALSFRADRPYDGRGMIASTVGALLTAS